MFIKLWMYSKIKQEYNDTNVETFFEILGYVCYHEEVLGSNKLKQKNYYAAPTDRPTAKR